MQFYALNSKGQIVNANQAQKQCNYVCTECGTNLRLRSGEHRQKHFFHLEPMRNCSLRKKGMDHLQLQNYLYHLLPANDCHLEYRFPKINRIADVVWMSEKIVFEIQCSPISSMEINERNYDYQSQGWNVVWILHDKRYNRETLSPAEKTLRETPHYFTNMDCNGQGEIYDQFEIVDKNKRLSKLSKLGVNLSCLKTSRNTLKTNELILCQRKHFKWPFHFEGDLFDGNDLEYLKAAIQMELSHYDQSFKKILKERAKRFFSALFLRPYQVILRYFLEKACR